MDVHPADGDPRTWCLAIRSKSPIRHGGNPKTALQPTSDEGLFWEFPQGSVDQKPWTWLANKKNIWKKSKNFTQILVLEDAAVGRSTLKYTLFSLGPGFWLEAWKFLHHPSPKSWVLSKLLGVVFQPSPTISNQYLICRAPTNTWKFRDICSNLFSLDVPPKKKRCETSTQKGKLPWSCFFFAANKSADEKSLAPGRPYSSRNGPPEDIGPPKSRPGEAPCYSKPGAFPASPPPWGDVWKAPLISPENLEVWKTALDIGITFPKNNAWISWSSKVAKKMVQFLEVLVNPPTKVNPISNCVSWK